MNFNSKYKYQNGGFTQTPSLPIKISAENKNVGTCLNWKSRTRGDLVSGFTLLEMLVAIFIFTIVVTVAAGAIINIIDINRKSREIQTVMGNVNLAIESLSRDIRFGSNYSCNDSIVIYPALASDCSSNGNTKVSLARDGKRIIYELVKDADGRGKLSKTIYDPSTTNSVTNDMTSAEVDINSLTFYVLGTDTNNPRVLITLGGSVQFSRGKPTTFSIQTTVAQRNL